MDPITAIGFATSILTFIDFSWSLVRGACEVSASATGTTLENTHISNVVEDLREVTEDLENSFQGKDKHERALVRLGKQCVALSKDLAGILLKLKAKDDSKWEGLKTKLKSMRKEKEVASIEHRLSRYRDEVMLRLNLMVCGRQTAIQADLDKLQQEGRDYSVESARQLGDIRGQLKCILEKIFSPPAGEQFGLSPTAEGPSSQDVDVSPTQAVTEAASDSLRQLRDILTSLETMTRRLPKENSILSRLYFDSMFRREDAVDNAEEGTFEWIVRNQDVFRSLDSQSTDVVDIEEHAKRQKVSQTFLSFLEDENGLLFIYGKAGSGKSTLMKFLSQDKTVQDKLNSWAGNKTLCLVSFFFWNSGDTLQMSLEGLYRSILFETLRQCPDLIPTVFPADWEGPLTGTPFRFQGLQAAAKRLLSTTSFPKHRFCLFIDGLDEYQGDSMDHFRLARQLRDWAQCTEVKVLCSARPHTEFIDTFTDPRRRLQLDELTRGDIRHFVLSQIGEQLEERDHEKETIDDYRDIADEVVKLAAGVFLWARLVVRSVLAGIAHDDSPRALQERIESTPRDLGILFSKMLGSIDPAVKKRSTKMLLLAVHNPFNEPLSYLAFSWLDDLDDEEFPFTSPMEPYSDEELDKRRLLVVRQLAAYTSGLLEVRKNKVEFFHRTVRDYLCNNSAWNEQEAEAPSKQAYFRTNLAQLKLGPRSDFALTNCGTLLSAPGNQHLFSYRYLHEMELIHLAWLAWLRNYKKLARTGQQVGIDTPTSVGLGSRGGLFFCYTPYMDPLAWQLDRGQISYVQARLEELGAYRLGSERVIRLLIASIRLPTYLRNGPPRSPAQCPAFLDFCFSKRLVRVWDRSDTLLGPTDHILPPVSVWLIFLRFMTYMVIDRRQTYPPEKLRAKNQTDIPQILQCFLEHGADTSAVVIAAVGDYEEAENLRIDTPSGFIYRELFYVEISQILQFLSPSVKVDTIRKLLRKDPRSKLSKLCRPFTRWNTPARPVKDRYKPLDSALLKDVTAWRICGVASDTEELLGKFQYWLAD